MKQARRPIRPFTDAGPRNASPPSTRAFKMVRLPESAHPCQIGCSERLGGLADPGMSWRGSPMRVPPQKFVHVVYRTRRFAEMLAWYETVFDAKVQYQDPALAFLTYDDEHHRFAFAILEVI